MRTWMLVGSLFFSGMSSPLAHAEGACETALTLTTVSLPPAIVPDDRATEISTQMLDIVARNPGRLGANDALTVLDETIRPAQEVVATFLQTRSNYPSVFEHNEANALATSVYNDLGQRLEALRDLPAAPAKFNWLSFRTETQGVNPDQTIREVRYLHFALRFAAGKLDEGMRINRTVLGQTTRLREYFAQVTKTLDLVRDRVESRVDDDEFRRRLMTIHDDVVAQGHLLDNVHLALEQRLQFDAITQDSIRTLLTLRLPLAAALGTPKDLSPLDPGTFAPATAAVAVVEEPAAGTTEMAAISDIIRLVGNARSWESAEKIVVGFVNANARNLTTAQVVKLGECMNVVKGRNAVLWAFVCRRRNLTQPDLVKLANSAASDEYRIAIMNQIKGS